MQQSKGCKRAQQGLDAECRTKTVIRGQERPKFLHLCTRGNKGTYRDDTSRRQYKGEWGGKDGDTDEGVTSHMC